LEVKIFTTFAKQQGGVNIDLDEILKKLYFGKGWASKLHSLPFGWKGFLPFLRRVGIFGKIFGKGVKFWEGNFGVSRDS